MGYRRIRVRQGAVAESGRGRRRSREGKVVELGWEGGGLRIVWRGG